MDSAEKLIEQVLLLRCQIGDKDALAELIGRYQKPLRYFISRLLDNEAMTEDIFQETWLTVIRKNTRTERGRCFSGVVIQNRPEQSLSAAKEKEKNV